MKTEQFEIVAGAVNEIVQDPRLRGMPPAHFFSVVLSILCAMARQSKTPIDGLLQAHLALNKQEEPAASEEPFAIVFGPLHGAMMAIATDPRVQEVDHETLFLHCFSALNYFAMSTGVATDVILETLRRMNQDPVALQTLGRGIAVMSALEQG